MKQFFLAAFLLGSGCASFSQDAQWAFNVLVFSSQKDKRAFSAKQVLGKPNVLPGAGEDANAWQPKSTGKDEYIKVGYLNSIKPKQILIGESYHPGYVKLVLAYDAQGKEYPVAAFTPKGVTEKSRLLRINASELNFYVFAIKVVVEAPKGVDVGIDVIGITESTQPVEVKIKPADVLKSNMVVKKLPAALNSVYPEFGPLLSPDGKTLYFSRRADPSNVGGTKDLEDIWFAKWDSNSQNWSTAENMGVPLNNKFPNFINSVSPDGNTILLGNSYKPNNEMDGGVSISYRTATGWSFPKRLIIEEEENRNDKANFYLSNSQKFLLMSVERKAGGFGGRDLYVSFQQQDSAWSKPLNLGSVVNSLGTEAAPFLASDDKTLYYTSDGKSGYGGSDIYVTRRLDDSWAKWSEPENLGPLVNTAFDESYFTLSASGDKGYFTSTGEEGGDPDIYSITTLPEIVKPLPVMLVLGKVIDSKTHQPVGRAKILFENLATGKEEGIASSHPINGEYQIALPGGLLVGYLASAEGYLSVHAHLDLQKLGKYGELRQDLLLTPIESNEKIVLNNLFFDFDKAELRKESFPELNRLADLLKLRPSMSLEISGHTDNVGSEAYNDRLSLKRAEAVVTYLTSKVPDSYKRILLKHYGESQPVADNQTAQGRQLNRRVECKVLSK